MRNYLSLQSFKTPSPLVQDFMLSTLFISPLCPGLQYGSKVKEKSHSPSRKFPENERYGVSEIL
jgi:hypothetical protein